MKIELSGAFDFDSFIEFIIELGAKRAKKILIDGTKALLEFRNFLNNKNVNKITFKASKTKHLHPILSGRLLSLKLLSVDPNKSLRILNTHHKSLLTKGNIISHYYELFTTSILLKNIEIMSFLIS